MGHASTKAYKGLGMEGFVARWYAATTRKDLKAAFKNFSEPVQALQEMYRVLKPGGKALIIDLRRDAAREAINQYVDGLKLSRASALFTKLTFRFMLLKRAYAKSDSERMICQAGFRKFEIREDQIGMEISLER